MRLARETSDLPVLVISADADLDRVQSVFSVGACDFLVVPFHMETLEEKVAKHVSVPREKRSPAEIAGAAEA